MECMSVLTVITLCIRKEFHSGIVKLFEGNLVKLSNSTSFTLV